MAHASNIKAFLSSAISSDSHLIQAYCGLVAVELVLKDDNMCTGHNVPDGIRRLSNANKCAPHRKIALYALAQELNNDLCAIFVVDKNGNVSPARPDKFPDIRYTRCFGDGWGNLETTPEKLETLANRVNRIRNYLRTNFGYAL
jgi:hypothetical protein